MCALYTKVKGKYRAGSACRQEGSGGCQSVTPSAAAPQKVADAVLFSCRQETLAYPFTALRLDPLEVFAGLFASFLRIDREWMHCETDITSRSPPAEGLGLWELG